MTLTAGDLTQYVNFGWESEGVVSIHIPDDLPALFPSEAKALLSRIVDQIIQITLAPEEPLC